MVFDENIKEGLQIGVCDLWDQVDSEEAALGADGGEGAQEDDIVWVRAARSIVQVVAGRVVGSSLCLL